MSQSLELIYNRLISTVSLKYYRFLFADFDLSERLIGLVGPRGVGKTTMLLQIIKKRYPKSADIFYFSADHIYFDKIRIYEFIEDRYLMSGTNIYFIDEIHKYPNWSQEIKNIYDGFPDIQIVFSGSSSLDLVKGSYDLSRRAKLYYLPGMSFREYLNFDTGSDIKSITLEKLLEKPQQYDNLLANIPKIKGHFNKYLTQGFYPFYAENPLSYHEKILAVIEKTIYEDIASFYNLKTANLHHFKKILSYLASIPTGTTNIHNIAKNLSIDDKTVSNYLNNLKEIGLINLIYPAGSGAKGLRSLDKIFLNNVNLMYALMGNIAGKIEVGTVRELYFIQSLLNAGMNVIHSKIGDYKVNDIIFEVGGRNKKVDQRKGVEHSFLVKDNIVTSKANEIPLILFGFLY